MISVGAAVYQVGISEHRSTAKEHLSDLLAHGADRPPRWTLDIVHSRGRRNVTVAVAIELVATERVLMPHLEVDFWPT